MKKVIYVIVLLFISIFAKAEQNHNQKEISFLLSEIHNGKDEKIKLKNYIHLSTLYSEGSKEGIYYAQQALEIAENNNWKEEIGLCHYHIAWCYLYTSNRELVMDHFQKATQFSSDPEILIYSYGCMSNTYSWEDNHEKAFYYANKALNISENTDSIALKADALMYLGDVYRYKNEVNESKKYYYEAIKLLNSDREHSYPISVIATYIYLTTAPITNPYYVLDYIAEIKKAYDYGNVTQRRLLSLTLIKITLAYTTSLDNERINQVQIDTDIKLRKAYIFFISLLVVVIALLFWQIYKRNKINKKLIEANEIRARFFSILNHDLRRPVGGLINYLQIKTEAPEVLEAEEASKFEQKTMETTKNLLATMEDLLFWSKSQMENFAPDIYLIPVSKLFGDIKTFFEYEKEVRFVFDLEKEDIKLKTDEEYVKTIMRNLTFNSISAVKNVRDKKIEWTCWKENGKIMLSIHNNGPEMDREKIKILYRTNLKENIREGLGLHIVRDLAKAINCQIEVQTSSENGTTFLLIFDSAK